MSKNKSKKKTPKTNYCKCDTCNTFKKSKIKVYKISFFNYDEGMPDFYYLATKGTIKKFKKIVKRVVEQTEKQTSENLNGDKWLNRSECIKMLHDKLSDDGFINIDNFTEDCLFVYEEKMEIPAWLTMS